MIGKKFTAEDYEKFSQCIQGNPGLRAMLQQACESERTLQRIFTAWPAMKDAIEAWDLMEQAEK